MDPGACLKNQQVKPLKAVVLSIAGFDPCGGAGLLMDQKAISRVGAYAVAVATALTAQNSRELLEIRAVDEDFFDRQLRALTQDMSIAAVKIGMVPNREILRSIRTFLDRHRDLPLVVDPILAASSGKVVLHDELREEYLDFLKRASLITPNRQELSWLLKREDVSEQERNLALAELKTCLGVPALLSGGHYEDNKNIMLDEKIWEFSELKLDVSARGTGCALSSLIAAYLAQKLPMAAAVEKAGRELHGWLREAELLGKGDALMG